MTEVVVDAADERSIEKGARDRLVSLLRELLQLDQADLDFGIYRIMNAKRDEIDGFLSNSLPGIVEEAFKEQAQSESGDERARLLSDRETASQGAIVSGNDPAQSSVVKELDIKIAELEREQRAPSVGAVQVFSDLVRFFERYYDAGDFAPRRRTRADAYHIPYDGSDVQLHWATKDQHFIKSVDQLQDYVFSLGARTVTFRVVASAEGDHNNVKASSGNERRFILDAMPVDDTDDSAELVLRFQFRPATTDDRGSEAAKAIPNQAQLIELAEAVLLSSDGPLSLPWRAALSEQTNDKSALARQLTRWARSRTSDYFIHKDLRGFLNGELDEFIKTEILHIDDITSIGPDDLKRLLARVQVTRDIARQIVDFVADLEDLQKLLWEKRKFVVETRYCISIGTIIGIASDDAREQILEASVNCDAQLAEWSGLGITVEPTVEAIGDLPSLMIDTRHFCGVFIGEAPFTEVLLAALPDLDDITDGVLFHSDNYQALQLMQARYTQQVQCIYIDPPYNTGNDGFPYKDGYSSSSWLSMMSNHLLPARSLCSLDGIMFISIDDNEYSNLRSVCVERFGADSILNDLVWHYGKMSNEIHRFANNHENIIAIGAGAGSRLYTNIKKEESEYRNRFVDFVDENNCITFGAVKHKNDKLVSLRVRKVEGELGRPLVDSDVLFNFSEEFKRHSDTIYWSTIKGNAEEREDFGLGQKPLGLMRLLVQAGTGHCRMTPLVLDYFAGSGTTGHAVICCNRSDGVRRKFLLVEQGDHFDAVLIPRLKKTNFSPEWKAGRPARTSTSDEAALGPRVLKIVRLESYEDTLNNLELVQAPTSDEPYAQFQFAITKGNASGAPTLPYAISLDGGGRAVALDVAGFVNPWNFQLRIKDPGSQEGNVRPVDLLETFNWLLGLRVQHIGQRQGYTAQVVKGANEQYQLEGTPRPVPVSGADYVFQAVTGQDGQDRRILVVWRSRPLDGGADSEADQRAAVVLNRWLADQDLLNQEWSRLYVNGPNIIETVRPRNRRWPVLLIEEAFTTAMFAPVMP